MTGCHRSGTSLLAALILDFRGISTDQRKDDLAVHLDNPMGFFESRQLVEVNDSLLNSIGSSWDRPSVFSAEWDSTDHIGRFAELRSAFSSYALTQNWVDKDPRLCLTYPAFLHILLKRVPLAAVLRDPLEVATSLYLRDSKPINVGLTIWFLYNHHLSQVIQEDDLLVNYSSLLNLVEVSESSELSLYFKRFFEKNGYETSSFELWEEIIQKRIKPSLNRSSLILSKSVLESINPSLLNATEKAFSIVRKGSKIVASYQEAFSSLPKPVLDAFHKNHFGDQKLDSQQIDQERELNKKVILEMEKYSESLKRELSSVHNSTSWRITAPVRRLLNHLRGH